MTLELLRDEIWQQTGEPSDLDPATDTQYDGGPLLTWVVNEAQRQVAFFKDKVTGRVLRFKELYGDMFFQSYYVEDTLTESATSTTEVELPADYGAEESRWNGAILEISGEKRVIVGYSGSRIATVHRAFTTAPSAGDSFTLYKSGYLMIPAGHAWSGENIALPTEIADVAVGNFFHPLKVIDVYGGTELEVAPMKQAYLDLTKTGTPTEWYVYGKKIIFDSAPDDERWYKLEYYRAPYNLVDDEDEPEIPEPYHYAIVLWGVWWALRRQQAPTEAWQAWNNFVEFLRFSVEVGEIANERYNDYGTMRVK